MNFTNKQITYLILSHILSIILGVFLGYFETKIQYKPPNQELIQINQAEYP